MCCEQKGRLERCVEGCASMWISKECDGGRVRLAAGDCSRRLVLCMSSGFEVDKRWNAADLASKYSARTCFPKFQVSSQDGGAEPDWLKTVQLSLRCKLQQLYGHTHSCVQLCTPDVQSYLSNTPARHLYFPDHHLPAELLPCAGHQLICIFQYACSITAEKYVTAN